MVRRYDLCYPQSQIALFSVAGLRAWGSAGLVTEPPADGAGSDGKPVRHELALAKSLNADYAQNACTSVNLRVSTISSQGNGAEHHGAAFSANGLFEPLWSREHIDHVQISAWNRWG